MGSDGRRAEPGDNLGHHHTLDVVRGGFRELSQLLHILASNSNICIIKKRISLHNYKSWLHKDDRSLLPPSRVSFVG